MFQISSRQHQKKIGAYPSIMRYHWYPDNSTILQSFHCYILRWFVTNDTQVLAVDVSILEGIQDIVNGVLVLPPPLNFRGCDSEACEYIIYSDNPIFFSYGLYKIITFQEKKARRPNTVEGSTTIPPPYQELYMAGRPNNVGVLMTSSQLPSNHSKWYVD